MNYVKVRGSIVREDQLMNHKMRLIAFMRPDELSQIAMYPFIMIC